MKRVVWCNFCFFFAVAVVAATDLEFDFYNNTDFDILHVYALPSGSDVRSSDLLGEYDCIPSSESATLVLLKAEDAIVWTLFCIDADGIEYELTNIPLRESGFVSLSWSAYQGVVWESE